MHGFSLQDVVKETIQKTRGHRGVKRELHDGSSVTEELASPKVSPQACDILQTASEAGITR